jgi:DNA-binding MarR family transcriptional regulator
MPEVMSKDDRKHRQLLETVTDEGRRMSTRSLLLHAVIADKLGLNPSDHKCFDLIRSQSEPLTAGRLAELTGLSTGAITGVIDRLEHVGLVVRDNDPSDRRRVVIRCTPERAPDLRPFFAPLREAMLKFCARYSSRELEVILSFMRGTGDVMEEQVRRLAKLDLHAPRPKAQTGTAKSPPSAPREKAPARRARRAPS